MSAMPSERPARKKIPLWVKVIVLIKRLKELLKTDVIHFDHRPPLADREVNAAGTDYIPPQLDPDYIDARSGEEHRVLTYGNGATTAGSDAHRRKKMRSLRGENKEKPKKSWPSRKIPSRRFAKKPNRKEDKPGR